MKKRFLALFLALVMCLALVPMSAFAADSDFSIENGVLKSYNGSGGDVVIPDGVTSIGDGAFTFSMGLTSVVISDGVTSIGNDAFNNCKVLTSVTIPNSVTSIGSGAFSGCTGLTSVTIPDSVTSIGKNAFRGCEGLTSVTIPSGVTSIESGVFSGCKVLTSVTIPNSVTTIGGSYPGALLSGAFYNCTALKDVYYGGTEAQWKAVNVDNRNRNDNDPLLNANIHYGNAVPTQPTTPTQPTQKLADARDQKLVINGGKTLTLHAFGLKDAKGNYTNYVSVRDLAWALSGGSGAFDVTWDNAAKAINLVTGKNYSNPTGKEGQALFTGSQSYDQNPVKVLVNGKEVKLELVNIGGGNTYYKLRDLGDQLGFEVGWDQAAGAATITTK